jgi:hypothetical protein
MAYVLIDLLTLLGTNYVGHILLDKHFSKFKRVTDCGYDYLISLEVRRNFRELHKVLLAGKGLLQMAAPL